MSPAQKRQLLQTLSPEESDWLVRWGWFELKARDNQVPPPGDWHTWLVMAGRGFGKTRTGAETVRWKVETGQARRVALVARTEADARDVMVEGESGILACSPPSFMPRYLPGIRRLVWPNGAIATTYSGNKPAQLRGPQHDFAWGDELAAWQYDDAWDQLELGLRLGNNPQAVVTTTPKNRELVKKLLKEAGVVVTRGTSYENRANLAAKFLNLIIKKYEGTRLGRQELRGDLLEDTEGALWKRPHLDNYRVNEKPECDRIEIGVDPSVSSEDNSDEAGIIVAGRQAKTGHGCVLEDLSGIMSPDAWAKKVVEAYKRHGANRVVAEVNNGGDLVELVIKTVDPSVVVVKVHAAQGKRARAEPVAAMYEQGRVHHLGTHAELEDELCTWTADSTESPNRLDAMVWVLTDLLLHDVATYGDRKASVKTWRRRGR